MGLFDKIAGEAQRNFIARADEAKDHIIYKYPERNIRMMTQLTVGAGRGGAVPEGRPDRRASSGPARKHTLDTNNVPFLSRLLEKFTGGNLFIAEIYFVSTREFPELKFGGPIGDVRDPETGLGIGTMVYGDFSVRVTDPEKLIVGLVGCARASNEEFLGWFKSQVLKVIRDRVAELLVKKKWPLLDVTSGAYTEEIETEVIAGVKPHVDSYGMTIVRLGNFNISIKPEDEATLKKLSKDVAYSRLAGGFQQYAQGQAMLGAAEGMAKGGEGGGAALQGMGLGVGFGMANMFASQQQQRPPAGGAPQAGGSFCPSCGQPARGSSAPTAASRWRCPRRRSAPTAPAELAAGAKFCPNCGKPAA